MAEGALTAGADPASPPGREPSRQRLHHLALARAWRSERGTAVVEFALVAPILFMLVFGIVDFARMMNYYNVMTQLAAQGARAAAVNRNPDGSAITSPSSIQQMIHDNYTGPSEVKNDASYHVCILGPIPLKSGDPVTVKTEFDFDFIPFIRIASSLTGKLHLTATTTLRAEALPVDPSGNPTYGVGDQSGNPCP
jgi:TadE-like protein